VIATASITDLLSIPAVQRSALVLALAAVSMPVIGVLIVGLDIITARFAVMHVALLGIAIGLWIGVEPYALSLVLCAVTGGLLALLSGRPGGLAGPMGFLMTVSIAAALLILSVSGVNANGAFELLWGSILATRPSDVWLFVGLGVAVLGTFLALRTRIRLLLFDRELALCSGIAVMGLTAVLLILVSVSIGASIKLTGALLVDAITLLPALAARNVAQSFGAMVVWAIAFGAVGNVSGFLVALWLDQPPGPMLVLVAGALTLASYFVAPVRRAAIRTH